MATWKLVAVRVAVAILVVASVAVGVLSFRSNQAECPANLEVVQPNDSLWGFARNALLDKLTEPGQTQPERFPTDLEITDMVEEIKILSGLNSSEVHEGQRILVPDFNC